MSRLNNICISSGTRHIKVTIVMARKSLLLALILCIRTFGFATEGEAAAVKVGIADHTVSQIALYVSKDKGYYAGEGLAVDLVLMRGAVSNLAPYLKDVNQRLTS